MIIRLDNGVKRYATILRLASNIVMVSAETTTILSIFRPRSHVHVAHVSTADAARISASKYSTSLIGPASGLGTGGLVGSVGAGLGRLTCPFSWPRDGRPSRPAGGSPLAYAPTHMRRRSFLS